MKTKIVKTGSLILMLFLSIFFIGCSTDDANEKIIALEQALGQLENNINDFSTTKEDLEMEIEDLKSKLNELEKAQDSDHSIIVNLRTKLATAESELKVLKEQLSTLGAAINVFLADEYYLVVNDTFQLFYRSIVQAVNPYGYYIKITCSEGHAYNRYYEYTPKATGTYDLKVEVCDNNGNVYGSDSTKLIVSSNTISGEDNKNKNILCIGDSLTYNGYWVSQGKDKYVAAGYTNVNFIGTKSGGYGGSTVNYEGYSGWQWSTYLTGATGDTFTDTPFRSLNDKNDISFKDYCTKNSFSGIDEVYFLLTWNGIGGKFREFSFSDSVFSNAKTLIDKLHSEYPNAKITLLSIPLPSVNAGLGAYYEVDSNYGDNYAQLVTAMNYNNFLEQWCKMDEYSSFMRYVDSKAQFDTENNMPTVSKPVNTENPKTEEVGSAMGMHPTTYGYLQIGDAFFRALMKKW